MTGYSSDMSDNSTLLTRRAILGSAAAASVLLTTAKTPLAAAAPAPANQLVLKPMTAGAQPISAAERATRLAKLQDLMHQQKVAALLVEAGSTLDYFTGGNWHLSERVTAAVIPASGKIVIVTPFFEQPTIEEMLQVPAEVRSWQESESPFALIAALLNDGGMPAGALAVDVNTRFFVFDTVTRELTSRR